MLEYATGLIRVLEKRILDQTDFERMQGAKTAADAFRVLNDTDYADNLLNLKPEEFEKALERDNKDLRKLFFKIINNRLLLDFLFLKQDYLKLKFYLKSKHNPELKKRKKPNLKIPRIKNPTPQKIDIICDLELYRARKKIAKKLRDKFLQKINKKDLDLNYDLDLIKTEARNYAYGSPIILEYYYKKLDAARKIRMIMNAKLNNIKHETGDFRF
ncbi:MAG: V-type ATPase subunit [bacterium]